MKPFFPAAECDFTEKKIFAKKKRKKGKKYTFSLTEALDDYERNPRTC